MRGEEAQAIHVTNVTQHGVVECHAKMIEEAIQEIEHVKADATLGAVGIEHPVRIMILIDALLLSLAATTSELVEPSSANA